MVGGGKNADRRREKFIEGMRETGMEGGMKGGDRRRGVNSKKNEGKRRG